MQGSKAWQNGGGGLSGPSSAPCSLCQLIKCASVLPVGLSHVVPTRGCSELAIPAMENDRIPS